MITRIITGVLICLAFSCGEDAANDEDLNTEAPAAMDSTTKHPSGMSEGAVISTDTAAMRVVDSTDN